MAFIHVQRRVRRLPQSSATVQSSVSRILECRNLLRNSTQPSPWVAFTGPLFTAGCNAFEEDRSITRDLL